MWRCIFYGQDTAFMVDDISHLSTLSVWEKTAQKKSSHRCDDCPVGRMKRRYIV
jgi:hypothetical protein